MKKTIKIAILATGDELTQGSIVNTNAQAMAQELFSQGFEPNWQMAVPDDTDAIETALDFLFLQHSVVITIGGLGPTSDDKTRFAVAAFLNQSLVEHAPSLKKLQDRYQKITLPFTSLSRQQALFPKNAMILENTVGSANGCMVSENQKMLFMLPGPPRECLPLFRETVLPQLISLLTLKRELLQWKVFGVAEGVIAEKVDEALKPYISCCRTSFRWDYPYVDCKVLLDEGAPEKEKILAVLNPILLPYRLGTDNQRATEQLKRVLIKRKEPVFIQDRATGGVLESLVHSIDNHHHVIFGQQSDVHLSFVIEGLSNYWRGEGGPESNLTLQSKKGIKTFTIPYRQALLEIYAAEFMAHQILLTGL